jgi:hypothetical protein
MAKLTGPLQFTGKIGNLTAFKMKGVDGIVLKECGGPSREKLLNDPQCVNNRRNMSEFGNGSTMASAIRHSFYPLKHIQDSYFFSRLAGLSRKMAKLDKISKWGERGVLISQNGKELEGLDMNKKIFFNTVIRHPLSFEISRVNGSANVIIPDLIPGVSFYNPSQFHLYRIIITLGTVYDRVFNGKEFVQQDPDLRPQLAKVYSDWASVQKTRPASDFNIQIDQFNALPEWGTLILSVGVDFCYPYDANLPGPANMDGCGVILGTA